MDPIRATTMTPGGKYACLHRTVTALACLTFLGCGEPEQSRDDGLNWAPGYDAGGAYGCNECVADAHCMPGMLCMRTKDGADDAGSFCLYRQAALADASCASAAPFTASEAGWTSVDGVSDVVCRHPTWTCTEYVNSVWD